MDTGAPAPRMREKNRKLVVLPIGSCEQHGPYLPIDTDLRIAGLLAEKLSVAFPETDTLLLPAIPFSCSWEHKGLGTLSLSVGTLSAMLHDIAYSLKTWNIPTLLVLVNWHGGNDVLATLAAEITAREAISTAAIPTTSQVGRAWDESAITQAKDIHAGAVETSIVQAYWPALVSTPISEKAHCEPKISPAKAQGVLQSLGSLAVTREGIWGAPEDADTEMGRKLIDTLVGKMSEQIRALLSLIDQQHN
jgi:creatinine amidohydrolase/Fe(II)-dependent formamide hydrolase-like protein